MNKPNFVSDRLLELIKSQNPKSKKISTLTDVLNKEDIQIDIVCDKIQISITDLNSILYGTGFKRLLLTINNDVKLNINSNRYEYAIRSGNNCIITSNYTSARRPVYIKLGLNNILNFNGSHDIKNNTGCKIKHI